MENEDVVENASDEAAIEPAAEEAAIEPAAEEAAIEAELLIEEISIDGMCGVY
ncbi:MAG TPA: mycofactocin precursor MftA [Ilumatobacteraceae bacterium]|nr:mycofactocin precursor MftA [Ilumatobacteraceae bacterium]